MENKRSKGVTIFAILILIGGILSLLSELFEIHTVPLFKILICVILHTAQIICAIGILKLKELARKITFYVYILLTFWLPFTLFAFTSKKIEGTLEKLPPEVPLEAGRLLIKFVFTFTIVISILWFMSVIYFFTRPKVKEQFK